MRSEPLAGCAARALAHALSDFPAEVYAEMGWLSDDDLKRLAKAAALLKQAAEDELKGRAP